MSHQASIAIKRKDGSVNSIYCYTDGYIFDCGANLYRYYLSSERVNELIDGGDIRYLGRTLYVESSPNNTRREKDKCSNPILFKSLEDYKDYFFYGLKITHIGCIESYLFDEETSKWLVGSKYCDKFISYEEALTGEIFNTEYTKKYIENLKKVKGNNDHINDYSNKETMESFFDSRIKRLEDSLSTFKNGENVSSRNFTSIDDMITILQSHRDILNGKNEIIALNDRPKIFNK